MRYNVLKPIIGGVILGSILFFMPFLLLKIIGFFLVISLFIWLFRGGRRRHWNGYAMAYADKVRSMTDEEYEEFKANRNQYGCGGRYSQQTEKNN